MKRILAALLILITLTSCQFVYSVLGWNEEWQANQLAEIEQAFSEQDLTILEFYLNPPEPDKMFHGYTIDDFISMSIETGWAEGLQACIDAGGTVTESQFEAIFTAEDVAMLAVALGNVPGLDYSTYFMKAYNSGRTDVVSTFISAGVITDYEPLINEVASKNTDDAFEFVLDLISYGADIDSELVLSTLNGVDEMNEVLMSVASSDNVSLFDILVQSGEALDYESALETAMTSGSVEVFNRIIDSVLLDDYSSALETAIKLQNHDMASRILSAPMSSHARAFISAIKVGMTDIADKILSEYCDFDFETVASEAIAANAVTEALDYAYAKGINIDLALLADIIKGTNAETTVLNYYFNKDMTDEAKILIDNGLASEDFLLTYYNAGDFDVCATLVEMGFPVNTSILFDIYNIDGDDYVSNWQWSDWMSTTSLIEIFGNPSSIIIDDVVEARSLVTSLLYNDREDLARMVLAELPVDEWASGSYLDVAISREMEDFFYYVLQTTEGAGLKDEYIDKLIQKDWPEVLRLYLGYFPDQVHYFEDIHSPLVTAMENGLKENFDILLEFGAEVNPEPNFFFASGYQSPLEYALYSSDPHYALALIEAGADVNASQGSGNGGAPLMCVACRYCYSEEVLVAMVANGADVTGEYSDYKPLKYAISGNNTTALKLLHDNGVDFNQSDREANAAYLAATTNSVNADTINALISYGADFDIKYDFTPVVITAIQNVSDPNAIAAMIEGSNIDIEVTDHEGRTPLIWAANVGSSDLVMTLLDLGANPKATDKDGKAVFDYARQNRGLAGTEGYKTLNSLR